MSPEQRAEIEQRVGEVEETTEQRMHAVADELPNPEEVHQKADELTERAAEHFRRAREARDR